MGKTEEIPSNEYITPENRTNQRLSPRIFLHCLSLALLFSHLFLSQASSQSFRFSEWKVLVPSPALPAAIKPRKANNNLDIVSFKGRYYVAFRTAPSHFASANTSLYLMSSTDFLEWRFETSYFLGADMREPRFLVNGDSLMFYFFEGGTHPLRFEPRHVWGSHSLGDGQWAPERVLNLDNYVPWRLRKQGSTIYLSAYYGLNLYSKDHQADLRLFRSLDGYVWTPLSEAPQVTGQSAEEGEFIFDETGALWATIRMEGYGGGLAYAHPDSLYHWHTIGCAEKYDSALLFQHAGEIYLLSRRNLDGKVDHAPAWMKGSFRRRYNLLRYSLTRKTTALYHLNRPQLRLEHITDLPAIGDNAFPGIAQVSDDEFIVLNYSSNILKGKKNWIRGQLGPTYIYWSRMRVE